VILFLALNALINYWELILWKESEFIREISDKYYEDYKNEKDTPMLDFMGSNVNFINIFSPKYWAGVWIAYSMYDRSYADRKSFGFSVDVGNGLSTLIPGILLHVGFSYHYFEAKTFGIIMLAMMWQMGYGTIIYWFSFIINKRHKLLSARQNIVAILGSNVPWFAFSSVGFYAAIRLVQDNDFSVFGI
jgi:hypothetical protein